MILIWGWRSLLRVLGVGEFHCPRCQLDTTYHLVRPRRWFTVFFIPVIPARWGEEYVECQRCKSAFRQEVLAAPTNTQLGYLLAPGTRAMDAKATTAGFAHSERMVDAAVAQLRPVAGEGYNEANLVADMDAFRGHDLAEYLAPLADALTLPGKEALVGGLVAFVYTDGTPPPEVVAVVEESAACLQLTAAHLTGIVATVTGAHPELS
jgi:hypothetical protein